MASWGAVLPEDLPLTELPAWLDGISGLGWSEVWAGEVSGRDAFATLAGCVQLAPYLRFNAIVPATTRGPALLAMSITTLADLAPGRISVALGASSTQVLAGWNNRPVDRPYTRLKDTFNFVSKALSGERVDQIFDTFAISGFKLAAPPKARPDLLLAGLGPRTLSLAADRADGVLLNWVTPADIGAFRATQPAPSRVATMAYYSPDEHTRELARRLVVAYANVPAYAEHHRRHGRAEALQPVWDAWSVGDRKRALAALPDRLLDDLVVSGDPDHCRKRLAEYHENGADLIAMHVLGPGSANLAALQGLGNVNDRKGQGRPSEEPT